MKVNSPEIKYHGYVGLTPLSVAHAISKGVLESSVFFHLEKYNLALHQRFWSKFEIELIKLFDPRFEFSQNATKMAFSFNGISLALGQEVEDNVRELRRKFAFLENLFKKSSSVGPEDYVKLEKDLFSIWLKISKHPNYQTVNFQALLSEVNNPLVSILFDWLQEAFKNDHYQSERCLIKLLSVAYLGGEHINFSEMQLFYLLAKLISPVYFFEDFSILVSSFSLDHDISSPKTRKTKKFITNQNKDFNGFLILSDGYFGKTFCEKIYANGLNESKIQGVDLNNCHEELSDPSYEKVFGKKMDSGRKLNFVEIVLSEKELAVFYSKFVDLFTFDATAENKYARAMNDNNQSFYLLKRSSLSRLTVSKWSKAPFRLVSMHETKGISAMLLNDSHHIGNIAALFYGE